MWTLELDTDHELKFRNFGFPEPENAEFILKKVSVNKKEFIAPQLVWEASKEQFC